MKRKCTKCKRRLSIGKFTKRSERPAGYASWCKRCVAKQAPKYRAKNEEHKRRKKAKGICKSCRKPVSKTNVTYCIDHAERAAARHANRPCLTREQRRELFQSQNDICPICDKPLGRKLKIVVDHEHSTGIVRGLLHDYCNRDG